VTLGSMAAPLISFPISSIIKRSLGLGEGLGSNLWPCEAVLLQLLAACQLRMQISFMVREMCRAPWVFCSSCILSDKIFL
jgi:hypothetical protein